MPTCPSTIFGPRFRVALRSPCPDGVQSDGWTVSTYRMATMMQERISSLALIHIYYLAEVNLDVVVDLFAKKSPRMVGLATLLKDSSGTTAPYIDSGMKKRVLYLYV